MGQTMPEYSFCINGRLVDNLFLNKCLEINEIDKDYGVNKTRMASGFHISLI